VNWLQTLPYGSAWAERYADRGLVVVGAQAPEFGREHDHEGVPRDSPAAMRSGQRRGRGSSRSRSPSAPAVTLDVLLDTIKPFPTFSEIYLDAPRALKGGLAAREQIGAVSR
jgi:hypothetical protein